MKKWILLLFLLLFMSPLNSNAQSNTSNRDEVFTFLEEAFQAQVSLSEKGRTMEEVKGILSPYFTSEYQSLFLKENLVQENGSYITYGSDFAPYFIPFFRFSDKTKVVIQGKEAYVFEYFPENNEGPVGYKSHYEGLRLIKKENSWQVAEYLHDEIPQKIIDLSEEPEQIVKQKPYKVKESNKSSETASLFFPVKFSAVDSLLNFIAIIGKENNTSFTNIFGNPDWKETVAFQ